MSGKFYFVSYWFYINSIILETQIKTICKRKTVHYTKYWYMKLMKTNQLHDLRYEEKYDSMQGMTKLTAEQSFSTRIGVSGW
jgi:hypothetical protein